MATITTNNKLDKIYNLLAEQLKAEKEKKATMKELGDNIKRIKEEIKELMDDDEDDDRSLDVSQTS